MKLAFIGTGKIIADALFAVQPVETIDITAIWARPHSRDKAEKFAEEFNIPEVYTDYAELLENTAADTVYIGLINSAHYPYAKEALLAGKNVILEKPFTGFYDQTVELQKIAGEKGLFIFEAVTVLHNEIMSHMKSNIEKLGKIKLVLCNYSQYSSRYDEYLQGVIPHAFDAEYYGGALFDINIYNIHYCVNLLGEPENVQYYPNLGPNGIDTSGALVLSYKDFTAVCTGAKDTDSPGYVTIQGEKGYMRIEGKPNIADKLMVTYIDENAEAGGRDAAGSVIRPFITEYYTAPEKHHRMTEEFEDFARIADSKDYASAKILLDETVQVMNVLEKARLSANIIFNRE
ncbi:MAG: Gfo/Idh/MocA family oxidoreductase [Clostridia bacterium]|nr:Gfo/Idh/MocA family oxidoreductase [Clostridia bacterium]